jgi:hypothetical protein
VAVVAARRIRVAPTRQPNRAVVAAMAMAVVVAVMAMVVAVVEWS